ncbi:MAG: lipid A ABC transporter permease/ATP-binding protein [Planctomycetota bacterium]|nr:MAG: lipid A ABC transporter permease/ATP-binding protein [Planctomycetota bacterium]
MADGVHAAHEDDLLLGKAFDMVLARRLAGYVRPYLRLVAVGLGLTVVLAGAQSLVPYLLGLAVDEGIVAGEHGALWRLGGLLLGIELVCFGAAFAHLWVLQLLGQNIMVDLRDELMRHLSRQSMAFYARQPAGRLVTRVTSDVGTIAELFTSGLVTVLGDLLTVVLAGGFLLWLEWRLALLVFAILPLVVGVTWLLKGRIRDAFRRMRRLVARLNATVAETVGGMQVVQALGGERQRLERFLQTNDEHLEAALGAVHYNALYASLITVLTGAAVAALLLAGGQRALGGGLQIGVLVAVITYAQRLYMPIRDLAEKYTLFQAAMAGAERVFRLLDTEIEVADPPRPRPLPEPARGAIEFRQVSFRYPEAGARAAGAVAGSGRPQALYEVSFRVEPGERVAIVGHTGAGKSTIINLLGRFYDPTAGQVLLDGVDVREVAQRELRRRIGIVHQEVFIFSGTVLDNIRMGSSWIDEQAAVRAAQAVGADAWIQRLPHGYHSELPERGATLSVGEKQLLSFARALAHDPPVLVLDEATASVDPETEAVLQQALGQLLQGRTAIVIAHRLATIRHVDRILVLHEGRLREQGSWDELLARRGLFYRLHQLQLASAPLSAS